MFNLGILEVHGTVHSLQRSSRRARNAAMAAFDSNKVVPVYYITFTLCSISGGGIVFQDFWGYVAR